MLVLLVVCENMIIFYCFCRFILIILLRGALFYVLFNFSSMKKYWFLCVLCVAFFYNGCAGDADPCVRVDSKEQSIDYAVYFSNPYDTIGKYHNKALEQIFTEYFKKSVSRGNEQEVLKETILDYLKEQPFDNSIIVSEEDINRVISASRVSNDSLLLKTKHKEICDELLYIMKYERGSSPQDLVSAINKLEKRINDLDVVEEEKVGLLAMTSVAKYSSIYWIEKFVMSDERQSRVNGDPNDPRDPAFDYYRWYNERFSPVAESVIRADFIGAFTGAIFAIVFGGPIGIGYVAITVIMQGAVTGSLASSVCEGVGIMWNLIWE